MFWFGKKKFDIKAEKQRLVKRIEQLQSRLVSGGVHKVLPPLDKVTNLLSDKYLIIQKEQAVLVDTFLSDMESHIGKQFEPLLLKKCEHISLVVRGECELDERTITQIKNEDRLFEMLGELDTIGEQIRSVEKKMEAALGTDKNLWTMLNSQRHTLISRMKIVNKNYQTLLESQSALAVASAVKKAGEEADGILSMSRLLDVNEFEENAELTNIAADDIRESSAKMQEIFDNTFGVGVDSYEYERALEEKLMEDAHPVNKHKAPAVDD